MTTTSPKQFTTSLTSISADSLEIVSEFMQHKNDFINLMTVSKEVYDKVKGSYTPSVKKILLLNASTKKNRNEIFDTLFKVDRKTGYVNIEWIYKLPTITIAQSIIILVSLIDYLKFSGKKISDKDLLNLSIFLKMFSIDSELNLNWWKTLQRLFPEMEMMIPTDTEQVRNYCKNEMKKFEKYFEFIVGKLLASRNCLEKYMHVLKYQINDNNQSDNNQSDKFITLPIGMSTESMLKYYITLSKNIFDRPNAECLYGENSITTHLISLLKKFESSPLVKEFIKNYVVSRNINRYIKIETLYDLFPEILIEAIDQQIAEVFEEDDESDESYENNSDTSEDDSDDINEEVYDYNNLLDEKTIALRKILTSNIFRLSIYGIETYSEKIIVKLDKWHAAIIYMYDEALVKLSINPKLDPKDLMRYEDYTVIQNFKELGLFKFKSKYSQETIKLIEKSLNDKRTIFKYFIFANKYGLTLKNIGILYVETENRKKHIEDMTRPLTEKEATLNAPTIIRFISYLVRQRLHELLERTLIKIFGKSNIKEKYYKVLHIATKPEKERNSEKVYTCNMFCNMFRFEKPDGVIETLQVLKNHKLLHTKRMMIRFIRVFSETFVSAKDLISISDDILISSRIDNYNLYETSLVNYIAVKGIVTYKTKKIIKDYIELYDSERSEKRDEFAVFVRNLCLKEVNHLRTWVINNFSKDFKFLKVYKNFTSVLVYTNCDFQFKSEQQVSEILEMVPIELLATDKSFLKIVDESSMIQKKLSSLKHIDNVYSRTIPVEYLKTMWKLSKDQLEKRFEEDLKKHDSVTSDDEDEDEDENVEDNEGVEEQIKKLLFFKNKSANVNKAIENPLLFKENDLKKYIISNRYVTEKKDICKCAVSLYFKLLIKESDINGRSNDSADVDLDQYLIINEALGFYLELYDYQEIVAELVNTTKLSRKRIEQKLLTLRASPIVNHDTFNDLAKNTLFLDF